MVREPGAKTLHLSFFQTDSKQEKFDALFDSTQLLRLNIQFTLKLNVLFKKRAGVFSDFLCEVLYPTTPLNLE